MMSSFKSPVSRLARLFKKSRDAWKEKAIERQERLRASQVKIRDLEESRGRWKERALAAEQALSEANSPPEGKREAGSAPDPQPDEAGLVQESLVGEDMRAEEKPSFALSVPSGHQYPTQVMQLAIEMVVDDCVGSRAVHRILERFGTWLPISPPAYTSILNWVYRCGLHVLSREIEPRKDWIYIADHTIALGETKCLVILGIGASELARSGFSPEHHAMQVLAIETCTHSDGAWCARVIEGVAQRIGAPVQIVADHGSDLHKGITLYQQQAPCAVYTYDISHRIATLLKADLGQDTRWNTFLGHCRRSLSTYQQTDLAFLLPPRQRTKARFMHVDEHIDWAQRLIAYHDRGDFSAIKGEWILKWPRYRQLARQFGARAVRPLRALVGKRYPDRETLRQALEASSGLCSDTMDETFWHACDMGRARFLEGFGWVLAYREDLREYEQLIAQSKTIQSVLKAKGLHQDSHAQIQAELPPPSTLFPRVAKFSTRILAHVEQEAAKVPENMTWLASSDIIESVFGKYKSFTAKGPLKEIGKLVLAIPVFVCNLSTQLIQEAMETVRMIDVEDWIDKHPGKSMLSRRRQALRAPTRDTQTA